MSVFETRAIYLRCAACRAFNFLADATNWPRYAIHNVLEIRPSTDCDWIMRTPRGEGRLRLHADARWGILDHEFIDPREGTWAVPARVVPVGEGCLFTMTFARPPHLSDEDFAHGMKLLEEELQVLKGLLESGTGLTEA